MSYIIYPIVVFYFISHPSQFFMYWIYFILFIYFFFVLNFSYFTRKENKMCGKLCLRVHLFWVKMISGNHFHPFLHVWLQRKIQFSGNCIPVDQNLRLWLGNEFTLPFSLQFISGKREREREREKRRESPDQRESERRESLDRRAPIVDRAASRTIAPRRRAARSTGAIDGIARCDRPDGEIARWECAVRSMRSHRSSARVLVCWDRIARHRSSSGRSHRSDLSSLFSHDRWFIFFCWVLVSLMIFFWVVACVLDLCFPSSFPNTIKYFPENFLKYNQAPWKHFPFPEISISGKYVFSGKHFTATKHSLKEQKVKYKKWNR